MPSVLFFIPDKWHSFAFKRLRFGTVAISLYYLENSVIRKRFNEARIHFAINRISVLPFIARKLRELKSSHGNGLFGRIVLGRTRIHYLNIISHHFMSRDEIDTPHSQERIQACLFKVRLNGEIISMCVVNAQGYRENYYKQLGNNTRI